MTAQTEGEIRRFRNPEININPVEVGQPFGIEPNLLPNVYEKSEKGENVQYDGIPFTLVLGDKERWSGVVEVHSMGEYYIRDHEDTMRSAITPAGRDFYDPSTDSDKEYEVQESRDRLPLVFVVLLGNPSADLNSRIECVMSYDDQEYLCMSNEEYNHDKKRNELAFAGAVENDKLDVEPDEDNMRWVLLPPTREATSRLQFMFRERQAQEPAE